MIQQNHAAIQSNLKRLEKWANKNFMKFNKESAKSCTWKGTAPYTSICWGHPAGKRLGRKVTGGPSGLI